MGERIGAVDDYVARFPDDVRAVLDRVRDAVHAGLPDTAVETIRYGMPTLALDGTSVVHFAGWKKHVSLYPIPAAEGELGDRIAVYESGRGTAKFTLAQDVPYDLITTMVELLAARRRAG